MCYGVDMSAEHDADSITLSIYSDMFKDRHGFRPRGTITIEEAQAYINGCREDDIDWEAEAEIDARIEAHNAAERAKIDDFKFEPWQIQAGRLPNVKEQWILDY